MIGSSISSAPESGELKPPHIVACFLVNFDMKEGYKMVWSRQSSSPAIDLAGLEYKCLPSGLHNTSEDTIMLAHNTTSLGLLYGVSKYLQNTREQHEHADSADSSGTISTDRLKVKMYSLGILCKELLPTSWKPNRFLCNGWEYIELLELVLGDFMAGHDYGNFEAFDRFFDVISSLDLNSNAYYVPRISNHPVTRLSSYFHTLGPLVFVIAKQALLRKKVLFLQQNGSKVSNLDAGSFVYLTMLLSLVPQELNLVESVNEPMKYSTPLYNVVLHDLADSISLFGQTSTIGCSNDTILLYQKGAYDYVVCLPSEEYPHAFIINLNHLVGSKRAAIESVPHERATLKDYHKFRMIYKEFYDRYKREAAAGRDDSASFTSRASSSFTTKFGGRISEGVDPEVQFNNGECLDAFVPDWWLSEATSPMTWREYIWSAFSWFATAGSVSNSDIIGEDSGQQQQQQAKNGDLSALRSSREEENEETLARRQFADLVEIAGFFLKLYRKWFYLINEIILEQLEDQAAGDDVNGGLSRKIVIELTYQDIVEMELDPYSREDLEFVKEFVMLYWSTHVREVEIGLGISGVCC